MAPRAPRPGTTPSSNGVAARKRAKRTGFKVTIGDEVDVLYTADIGPNDDFLCRKQTGGIPLSQFLTAESFGLDSIGVIRWTARRKAGDKRLTLQRVLDEMPSFEEIERLNEEDRFKLERLEEVDDDVIDVDSEVLPDPLPSGGN
jgi:hypothetical protein